MDNDEELYNEDGLHGYISNEEIEYGEEETAKAIAHEVNKRVRECTSYDNDTECGTYGAVAEVIQQDETTICVKIDTNIYDWPWNYEIGEGACDLTSRNIIVFDTKTGNILTDENF